MVECKRYRATIPETTCAARQSALINRVQYGDKHFAKRNMATHQYHGCDGCTTGIKIYYKNLKGEKNMKLNRRCQTCEKSYPLTIEFFDKFPKGFTLACRYCRGTKQKPQTNPVKSISSDPVVEKTPIQTKICKLCKKEFKRGKDEISVTWDNRRYCSADCRVEAEKIRKKKQKADRPKKGKKFDIDTLIKSPPEGLVVLDLRKENGLLDLIGRWAGSKRRDVPNQILWHLEDRVLPDFEEAK